MKQETQYINELPRDPLKTDDLNTKIVKRAIKTLQDFIPIHELFVREADLIIDQYDNGFYADQAEAGIFMHSKETLNMHKKVMEKLDTTDWYPQFANRDADRELKVLMDLIQEIQRSGKDVPQDFIDQKVKQIQDDIEIDLAKIKIGLEFLLRQGGYYNVMTNPTDGVFFWICLVGNCFVFIELNNKDDCPIKFYAVPADKVYVPARARRMRGSAQNRNVDRLLIVFDGDYDDYITEVVERLPEGLQEDAKNIKWGNLPMQVDNINLDQLLNGAGNDQTRPGQWAMWFDIQMGVKATIAGSAAQVVEKYEGEEYPYVMNGEKFIPLAHMICHPKGRGILGGSVGHYMSEPTSLDQQNTNSGTMASLNAQHPIYAMGIPDGTTAEDVQKRLREAEIQRSEGLMGIMTYNGSQGVGKIEQFTPEAKALQENQFIKNTIEDIKLKYGINQSDISMDTSKRVGVADLEAANQVAVPQQIGQNNAAETKFLLDYLVCQAKKINRSNKTPVPAGEVTIKKGQIPVSIGGMLLGELPDLLKKYDVIITIDDETGVTPNSREKRKTLTEMLQVTAGSPVQYKIAAELGKASGFFWNEEDFYPPQPVAQNAQQPSQTPAQ